MTKKTRAKRIYYYMSDDLAQILPVTTCQMGFRSLNISLIACYTSVMQSKPVYLYCFSPLVMLLTFIIEISFAIYVLWRYKMTVITRLVIALLAMLAVFQGTEYMLCGGMSLSGGIWSRIGYSAITMLPALGLHLVYSIAGKKSKILVPLVYACAVSFILFFVATMNTGSGHVCYANYAVFEVANNGSIIPFTIFYYGWMLLTIFIAHSFATKNKKISKALYALMFGYAAFIVPTTAINIVDPTTIAGIPSIMCGFAVILAFVLVGRVAPKTIAIRNREMPFRLKLPF